VSWLISSCRTAATSPRCCNTMRRLQHKSNALASRAHAHTDIHEQVHTHTITRTHAYAHTHICTHLHNLHTGFEPFFQALRAVDEADQRPLVMLRKRLTAHEVRSISLSRPCALSVSLTHTPSLSHTRTHTHTHTHTYTLFLSLSLSLVLLSLKTSSRHAPQTPYPS